MKTAVVWLSVLCFSVALYFLPMTPGFAADPKPLQPIKVPSGKGAKPPAPNPTAGQEKQPLKAGSILDELAAGKEDETTRIARVRSEAEKEIRAHIEHIRARAADMENTYGFAACAATLKKFLAAQGITKALESITNWDRVPFTETWQNAWKNMYDSAVSELSRSLKTIQDYPHSAQTNLALLGERMKEWDKTEQTIRGIFQQALEKTTEVAGLHEKYIKVQSDYTNKLMKKWSDAMEKKMKAELKAIEDEMAGVRAARREIFSESMMKAKERPSFVIEAAELPLPPGLKRPPATGDPQKEKQAAKKRKALEEALKKARAAEVAAQKAASAVEESKKDTEFMKKRHSDYSHQAKKTYAEYAEEYNKTPGEENPAAEKLYKEYENAEDIAEKARQELNAQEQKQAALEKNLDSLKREADKAWAEYKAIKAAIEKGE